MPTVNIPDFDNASVAMRTVEDASNNNAPITVSDTDWLTASFNRPANTTAYAIGDCITDSTSSPTALTFSGVAQRNGAPFMIGHATLLYEAAPPATIPNIDLLLFNKTSAPTANNDNAAFNPSNADMETCIGIIQFTSGLQTQGSSNMIYYAQPTIITKAGASLTDIYGLLRTNTAFTPASAAKFFLSLGIYRD